ncbi:MAG: histidine kinase [Bacteroidales bacterium]|jgi:signal transduction histidine kinase|nr:histidine kinase [Bacteroidales bacterium]
MTQKKELIIRRNITIILSVIGFFTLGAMIFTNWLSWQNDHDNHIVLKAVENVNDEILLARLDINNVSDRCNNVSREHIAEHLKRASDYMSEIKHYSYHRIWFSEYDNTEESALLDSIAVILDDLTYMLTSSNVNNLHLANKRFTGKYINFLTTFNKLELSLQKNIYKRNSIYRDYVTTLVAASFLFLVLCVITIIMLIKALVRTDRTIMFNTIRTEQKERHRIASDLHDQLGALLTSIGIYSKLLEKDLADDFDSKRHDKAVQLKNLTTQALETVEEVINNLNPSVLQSYGLEKAMEEHTAKLNGLNRAKFRFDMSDFDIKLEPTKEETVFRICTELFNNAIKHSGASRVFIFIYNDKKRISIKYSDNGIGFNVDYNHYKAGGKMGLRNLRNRVESLGGIMNIESSPRIGVDINIEFQVKK